VRERKPLSLIRIELNLFLLPVQQILRLEYLPARDDISWLKQQIVLY
jgi:hypothetical protein